MSALCTAFHQWLVNLKDQDKLVAITTNQVIFCYVTEIVRRCLSPQSAYVRISPQDTAPVTPDDPSLRAAQWFSPPNLRDAGYENLISSRPSSALHRKIHRRVVQGKEATSDLTTRLCLRNLQDEELEPPQNPKNTGKVILRCIIYVFRTWIWHHFYFRQTISTAKQVQFPSEPRKSD